MPPPDELSKNGRPIVLTTGAVAVVALLVIALVVALKVLPATKAPETPAVPAYPDLSARVTELEQQLAAAKSAPPAYPDLSGRVAALEATLTELQRLLAEAQAAPAYTVLRNRIAALESEGEATRDALAAARKSEVEARSERDELADRSTRLAKEVGQLRGDRERMQKLLTTTGRQLRQASAQRTVPNERETALAALTEELQTTRSALADARDDASRTHDALAALQRVSTRDGAESSASRAQLDRLRDANDRLADENQRLRATLARPVGAIPVASNPTPVFNPRTHVIAAGDTLARLSTHYYGTPGRWPEIYNANAGLLGPTGTLRVGTVLQIP